MKKLALLFLAASSVSANMNTWYGKDLGYPETMRPFMWEMHQISGDNNYYKFESNLRKNQDVLDEFANNDRTGLISYLLFEDNKIVIDEVDMPRMIIQGQLPSNSMGKSFVSYVVGHAICEGYIKNVNEKITGWDVVENTLYEDASLIDLLNMRAGDQHYIGQRIHPQNDNMWKSSGVNLNMTSLETISDSNLQNTTKGNRIYNYSALTTHVLMNYARYKAGDNFEELLDKVFIDKAKIKNNVYFEKTRIANYGDEQTFRYSFYADRYDYLRIAKAIMDDWNGDGCVSDYLHTIHDRRIVKNNGFKEALGVHSYTKTYGGQFHFDVYGLQDTIIGLDGFAGQQILINVNDERILVINSKYKNYDWEEIVYQEI
jgi:hypothetical protein